MSIEQLRQLERRLSDRARTILAESLSAWGGHITPTQGDSLRHLVCNTAVCFGGGVTKVTIDHGAGRRIQVDIEAATHEGGSGQLVWTGSIGSRGGVKGRRIG